MNATLQPLPSVTTEPAETVSPRASRWLALGRQLRRRPFTVGAVAMLMAVLLAVILNPLLPLPDPSTQALLDRLRPPLSRGTDGTLHLAGTDQLGRDVLSRALQGGRTSLSIALVTVLVAGLSGSVLGLLAGYHLGLTDQIVMRAADLLLAFPPLLLAVFLLYLLGPSLTNLVALLAVWGWIGYARIARAQTLSLRQQAFVEGAVALGCSHRRVLFRHILPHILPSLLVTAVFEFAGVMLAEAGLSFLGLGVQPPDASWGLMLAQGQDFVTSGAWWLIAVPGLAMFLVTFPTNLATRWAHERLGGEVKEND